MVTAKEVTAALDKHNISHGSILHSGDRHNHSFTDRETVFVKVARVGLGYSSVEKELQFAEEYKSYGVSVFPLYPELIDLESSDGDQHKMSVWEYHNFVSLEPENVTVDEATKLAVKLDKIHSLPHPARLPIKRLDSDSFGFSIGWRIDFAAQYKKNIENEKSIKKLIELRERFIDPFVIPKNTEFVVNHGDCHIGNSVRNQDTGELSWVDFEAVGSAPRESDLAKLINHLVIIGGNHKAWEAALTVFEEKKPVNFELMRKLQAIRLISGASYTLLHQEAWDIFERRIRQLDGLRKTGELPVRLARTDM
jgi:hypothetical protein